MISEGTLRGAPRTWDGLWTRLKLALAMTFLAWGAGLIPHEDDDLTLAILENSLALLGRYYRKPEPRP